MHILLSTFVVGTYMYQSKYKFYDQCRKLQYDCMKTEKVATHVLDLEQDRLKQQAHFGKNELN